MNRVFSFDAETNGLWGQAFAIGALVLEGDGLEVARFIGRCPIEGAIDPWVEANVLPQLTSIAVTHGDYKSLLADFACFYLTHKTGADMVVHLGYIVEAKILRDMHELGLIGNWDGPYPLLDISGHLQQAGEDPISVADCLQKYSIGLRGEYNGGQHNPLYDSEAAARVYLHLRSQMAAKQRT